ncbi:MAG: NAD(P)H-dependent oxidoreductase [Nanoarchaeota archaeon]
MKNNLDIKIILGSTREGRLGERVSKFVNSVTQKRKNIIFDFIDLKDWNIPFLNDKNPPGMGIYSNDIVKKWAKKIDEGDAYIIITPEYNRGYPAVLKNVLDVIYKEWNNKPVAFVSYGGSVGGSRAVEQLRQVAIELQMAPIREGVHIAMIWEAFDQNNELKNKQVYEQRVESMLDQLFWWANALKEARSKTI